jgi:hypothetical protein
LQVVSSLAQPLCFFPPELAPSVPQICQPSPAAEPSDSQLMLVDVVTDTPDGQFAPSYSVPPMRRWSYPSSVLKIGQEDSANAPVGRMLQVSLSE